MARIPLPVDIFVGKRLRELRRAAGLTQGRLAGLAGISLQQVQKYESGANRLSAGILHRFADLLGKDIGAFFVDEEKPKIERSRPRVTASILDHEILEKLLRITDIDVKHHISGILDALAD